MKRRIAALLITVFAALSALAQSGEMRFYLRTEPKTFNPVLVADESSEAVRYLTGGVLIRANRQTQKLEPELATAWKVSKDGRSIIFTLRNGVYFSDGTPFSAADVAYTVQQLMDPALHSPTGDSFRSASGQVQANILGANRVTVTFPAPVAGLEHLFDQVAIMSAKSPLKEKAVLGPFYVADYRPGSYVLLKRNANYWKKDSAGNKLPYLDAIRLEVQTNRDIEVMKLMRGEVHLINTLDAEYFDRIASTAQGFARDAGPSLDSEQMWFNEVAKAPIPAYKREWFRSTAFRRAISTGINRDDMCRVVYRGHARPAIGPVSPANQFWFNSALQPTKQDQRAALSLLQKDGFRLSDGVLRDRAGNAVEFSIVTNAGNKGRERLAAMIQQDLKALGIKVNVVTLDFPSLIERITSSFNYEAALLGLVNNELDPNSQMNVWLSSSDNHQWNPSQKSPESAWEAEIDRLMRAQASTVSDKKRKAYFDRVQAIVYEQAPFIYLVNKNAMSAVAPSLLGASPVVLRPQTYWNAEYLKVGGASR